MSLSPSRPARAASQPTPRTVLLGYLLRQGAHDRVLQILARVEHDRIDGLLRQLATPELAVLAELLLKPAGRPLLKAFLDLPLQRLLLVASPEACKGLLGALPAADANRQFAALPSARRHALVRNGAWPAHQAPKSPEPRPDEPFAAFRLRRLFRT
jgi:hypothetical protein